MPRLGSPSSSRLYSCYSLRQLRGSRMCPYQSAKAGAAAPTKPGARGLARRDRCSTTSCRRLEVDRGREVALECENTVISQTAGMTKFRSKGFATGYRVSYAQLLKCTGEGRRECLRAGADGEGCRVGWWQKRFLGAPVPWVRDMFGLRECAYRGLTFRTGKHERSDSYPPC